MPDSEHEHWPSDPRLAAHPAEPVPRYDSRNGMREHTYRPAGEVKMPAEEVKKDEVGNESVHAQQQWPAPCGPMMGYGYGVGGMQRWPFGPVPASAYYGYPSAPAGDASAPPKKEDKPTTAKPRKWQGRTRAEVEEDDMRIAASESAYAPRKVVPVGMADDQMVWVVESTGESGSNLMTYAEVKEMKGEWKADPRFKDAWFFVREAEEERT